MIRTVSLGMIALMACFVLAGCHSPSKKAAAKPTAMSKCETCGKMVMTADEVVACKHCGAKVKAGDMVMKCPKCGAITKVADIMTKCPKCGKTVLTAEALKCRKCGAALATDDMMCAACAKNP
jgi:DNA-directed RNA polymerase subunit RPC12/RpoP